MKTAAFTKFVQKQKPLWLFSAQYNYVLVSCALPLVVLGKQIFDYISKKVLHSCPIETFLLSYFQAGSFENNLTFLEGVINFIFYASLIFGVIIIFTCFAIAHIGFLKKYTSKNFRIYRSGTIIDDIKFIVIFFLLCLPFNIIMQLFLAKETIYRVLSIYLVQTPILYLMLKLNWFGYKISKRSYILRN